MVVMVQMVQVSSALHLPLSQPIDEQEEEGQGKCGDYATGY